MCFSWLQPTKNCEPKRSIPMRALNPTQLDASKSNVWEQLLEKVPILGWTLAWAMYYCRTKPIINAIKHQLKEREGIDVQLLWNETDWPIASKLLEIIRRNYDWKPSLFIPKDPCRIVLWAYSDCLDSVDAQKDIESTFMIEFSDEELDRINSSSLIEFVDLIKIKSNQRIQGMRQKAPRP